MSSGDKDSRCAFRDSSKGFTQVFTSTNKRHLEGVFPNVVLIIRHGEDFGFLLSALQPASLR